MSSRKVEQSDKKFQAAITAVEGNIWTNNAKGEMVGEQQGWTKLTGQTYEEYKGYGWTKTVHPDDAQPTVDAWNDAVNNKKIFEFEHRVMTKENGWRLFSIKAVPTFDENGLIDQWVGVHTDITEQREITQKIKESESRFRTLAETLPQLVWITDEKGIYEYASRQWNEYSGLDPHEEGSWESLVHEKDMDNLMQAWATSLQTGATYHAEARLKNKEGVYRWHVVNGKPIREEKGNIIKWIGAFTDIENLKAEQQRKNNFISMASHELKTPVTTMKAYGQIVEGILKEKGEEQLLGMVKKMSKQVNKLTKLIEDLLDVTKIQRGGLSYNETVFNFNELVKDVIDDMQKTSDTHKIFEDLETNIEISGDKDKLGQVINNLISNAIKYSPNSNKIKIQSRTVEDGVQLSVQDFGIGISIEQQKHVFEQFYRVTGENQFTFSGMGIGLYICSEIVKKNSGKIWIESSIGHGSIFFVWLPLRH